MPRIFKRADSSYWWVRLDGRRVSTGLTVRAAALRWVADRVGDTSYRAADKTTLRAALEQHARDRRSAGRAEGTLHMIGIKSSHLARVLGADTPLARIGAPEVDAYRDVRRREGAAPPTIAKELGVLSGALRLARRRGEYHRDPRDVMPIGLSRASVPRTRHLTPDQARALLRELAPGRAAHVLWILATGSRWSESVRARAEDVGPKVDGFRAVRLRGSKTVKSDRVIPVLGLLLVALRGALRLAPEGRVGRPLFATWGNVRRDLHAACARAGVPAVTSNDLRRSYSTHLHQRGVPTTELSRLLGHTDTRMVVSTYGQDTTASLAAALRRAT